MMEGAGRLRARDRSGVAVRLRDVELADLDAYARMRCDPVMMAELGGPLPREEMAAKVRRDAEQAAAGAEWIKMIIPDEAAPDAVAGSVALWSHEEDGVPLSEIGKQAVRMLLELARADGRWGLVHAFPGVTNGPSNGICRSLGFTLTGERDITFGDRPLRANHWVIDPGTSLG